MVYLGIDIGKRSHAASLMREDASLVFKAFSFSNSRQDAQLLLDKLAPFLPDVEIGMEATGHYWLSLYSFLVENGLAVHVINPIQTDGWRQGVEIRKRKTDQIDSVLIADFIRYGAFLETSLADEDTLSLRNLSRFRNYLISSISDLKRKAVCILDQIFPEYDSCFSDVFGKTSQELLLHFASASDFEDISAKQLEQLLSGISQKQFARRKLQELSTLARSSFGVTFSLDSFSLQLKLLIQQIAFIEQQAAEVELQINRLLAKINSPITTIPGIGPVLAAAILGEIGGVERFRNAPSLVAYAGIDAEVSQSGEYEAPTGKMTKRGSPYLRKALFQAALVASNCDPVFRAYYLKKRAEGKHHKVAVGAVARKLCHTIYAVLKNNTPYRIMP